MDRFICNDCGSTFPEATMKTDRTYVCGVPYDKTYLACPFCGSQGFVNVSPCQRCGRLTESRFLCEKCQRALRTRFSLFLFGLEEAEREQLDEWLEGVSVMEFLEGAKEDEVY